METQKTLKSESNLENEVQGQKNQVPYLHAILLK